MTTDEDDLAALREAQSLIERAARKEREALILNQQAATLNNDARALRTRAAAITASLNVGC